MQEQGLKSGLPNTDLYQVTAAHTFPAAKHSLHEKETKQSSVTFSSMTPPGAGERTPESRQPPPPRPAACPDPEAAEDRWGQAVSRLQRGGEVARRGHGPPEGGHGDGPMRWACSLGSSPPAFLSQPRAMPMPGNRTGRQEGALLQAAYARGGGRSQALRGGLGAVPSCTPEAAGPRQNAARPRGGAPSPGGATAGWGSVLHPRPRS